MKNKKKRPNKFRIRLFIIFWIALVIPCMLISYILYQNSQEKSKQSMAEDIQHTLTENMASVEGKLDAVSDAGVSLKFAMEQNNVVMIPDLKCRDIDIYSLVQKTFSTYTSLLDETYNVGGFSGFYLYYPYRQLMLLFFQMFCQIRWTVIRQKWVNGELRHPIRTLSAIRHWENILMIMIWCEIMKFVTKKATNYI